MKKIYITFMVSCLIMAFTICDAQVIRKNYREMTEMEKQIFVDALYELGPRTTTGTIVSDYATNHAQLFSTTIHNNDDFLPWHRWFILHFERALQNTSVAGAEKIALPYWDWISGYYTISPTDRMATAPLWDVLFLGQFNLASGWNLSRNLGGAGLLGTQATLNTILNTSSFTTFRSLLEINLHNGPHNWVGGVMAGPASPGDPIFYLHHNMVDKIWQNWLDLGGVSSFSDNNMPNSLPPGVSNFPSGVPSTTPSSITDSRDATVKVWFAENGKVILDKYTVSGDERYTYTGVIEAGKREVTSVVIGSTTRNYVTGDFVVPAGTTCTFISGGLQMGTAPTAGHIRLLPGFSALAGSTFHAKINAAYFNDANAGARSGLASLESEQLKVRETSRAEVQTNISVSPNPARDFVRVTVPAGPGECSYRLLDAKGIIVGEGVSIHKTFDVNVSAMRRGIYLLVITTADRGIVTERIILQ